MAASQRALVLERIARLERELLELRRGLDAEQPPAKLPAESFEVLLLEAGDARVAIPVTAVIEVLPRVLLFSLPGAAAWQAGYMRWRGEHVSVLDLGARWSGRPLPVRLEDRIVVLRHAGRLHGLLVEDVAGVEWLSPGETTTLDEASDEEGYALALAARAGRSFLLIALDRLFEPAAELLA